MDPFDLRVIAASVLVVILGGLVTGGGRKFMVWYKSWSIRGRLLRLSVSVEKGQQETQKQFEQQNESIAIIETDVRQVKQVQATVHEELKEQRHEMERHVGKLHERVDQILLNTNRHRETD